MNPEGPLSTKNGECYSTVFGNSTFPFLNLENNRSSWAMEPLRWISIPAPCEMELRGKLETFLFLGFLLICLKY